MFRGFREEERILDEIFLNELYRRAAMLRKRYSVRMEDFFDLYGKETVIKDLSKVEKMRKRFNEENAGISSSIFKIGITFEGMIIGMGNNEKHMLFGPSSCVIGTSDYDDFFGGVDLVVEFWEEGENDLYSHLGLAVDVTTGRELERKLGKAEEDVRRGNFARVKYFSSQKMNFRGELSRIPRIIIAADSTTVKDFGGIWLSSEKNADFEKRVREHFLNFQILEEIILQLETWVEYARRNNRPESEILIYERSLRKLKRIYEERVSLFKGKIPQEVIDRRDRSFETLFYYLESILR